jgi:hypothetical protein
MAKKKTKKKKATTRKSSRAKKKSKARADRKLDEGLRETFPASDPPAQTDPTRSIKE